MSNTFTRQAKEYARRARLGFQKIRNKDIQLRNQILRDIQKSLTQPDTIAEIIRENQKDLQRAQVENLASSLQERLMLNEARIADMMQAVETIIQLPDPVNEILSKKNLENGICLLKRKVPLGVFFMIYESRPNVTMDVAIMMIKSANTVILRGGKEAKHSNAVLHKVIVKALAQNGFSQDGDSIVQLVNESSRDLMKELLQQSSGIDLVIPRGGPGLINFVNDHSKIPVIKHDKGVCNLYVDQSANYEMAISIILNAKLQRPSVCNAIENLLIHSDFPDLKKLILELLQKGVKVLGEEDVVALAKQVSLIKDDKKKDEIYAEEFLDERLSVKIVNNIQEAFDFMAKYGSGHSEAIVSESKESIEQFQNEVDAAALLVNCSTRFHDGGQMGLGAEIGISTTRFHARGPMGLSDLTSTSYILTGTGQIRSS